MTYRCEYCNKVYKRESAFFKHTCDIRYRWEARHEKEFQIAYDCYNRWRQRQMAARSEIDLMSFIKSRQFKLFYRLGLFCTEVNCKNPREYVDWLVVNEITSWDWLKESTYNRFCSDAIKKEPASRAAERFVLLTSEWGKKTGNQWNEYWDKAGLNLIYYHMLTGKISPWIIFTSTRAQQQLDQMPDEMLQKIIDTVDVQFWRRRMSVRQDDVAWLQEMFE